MNFDSIISTFKSLLNPNPKMEPFTMRADEHLGNAFTPQRQAQLDAENDQFLKKWNSQPTPTPTPAQTVSSILGADSQSPGDDLWSKFSQVARDEATKRGYNADAVIKQKALESNFGRSNFAKERNNFGGIGAYDRDPNKAFNFDDIQSYLDYYFNLVEKRYPDAYANRQNPEKFIGGLKKGGYATDPEYVWKVMNTPLNPR